uniref:Uncharacterized protein n=1 Tax=Siphoviridae sp. ctDcW16 TaxID=2826199 RepID=A0A8S5MTJ4_9CAUD|nr:MAG TPA: hypothetical protein [Siphoviridae sp. ctDcW16]
MIPFGFTLFLYSFLHNLSIVNSTPSNYFLSLYFLSTFIPYSRQSIHCREWEA